MRVWTRSNNPSAMRLCPSRTNTGQPIFYKCSNTDTAPRRDGSLLSTSHLIYDVKLLVMIVVLAKKLDYKGLISDLLQ